MAFEYKFDNMDLLEETPKVIQRTDEGTELSFRTMINKDTQPTPDPNSDDAASASNDSEAGTSTGDTGEGP